jgi:hypothetical protein
MESTGDDLSVFSNAILECPNAACQEIPAIV